MTDSKGDSYIESLFQSINEKNAEITHLRAELSAAYVLAEHLQDAMRPFARFGERCLPDWPYPGSLKDAADDYVILRPSTDLPSSLDEWEASHPLLKKILPKITIGDFRAAAAAWKAIRKLGK